MDGIDDTARERQKPALYETALFRIAQESLTNIARHAHAQHASISLTRQQDSIHLHVRDDGCGYDSSQRYPGTGIVGMRERANSLGGTMKILSQPGRGTSIEAIIPLCGEHAEEGTYA